MGLHFHDPGALPFSRKIFRPREPRGYSHTRLRSRPCSLSDGEYGNWPNAWRTTFPFIRIRLIFRLSSRHPIAPNLPGFYRPPRPIQVLTKGFLTRHTPMALIFLNARLEKPRPCRKNRELRQDVRGKGQGTERWKEKSSATAVVRSCSTRAGFHVPGQRSDH